MQNLNTIEFRWEWSGNGKWDGGVTDCTAQIGDDAYAAIDDEIMKTNPEPEI